MGANVDTESLIKIRYGIIKLQNVANKGFSEVQKSLGNIESEIKSVYHQGSLRITQLESEIRRLEREADELQSEYNEQLKAAEEAKAEGKPYTLPYVTPGSLREKAEKLRKQLNELKPELDALHQDMKAYKDVKEALVTEFKKITTSGGDDSGQMQNVLEHSIEALDQYVHTNFSGESASTYSGYSEQMHVHPVSQPINFAEIEDTFS